MSDNSIQTVNANTAVREVLERNLEQTVRADSHKQEVVYAPERTSLIDFRA